MINTERTVYKAEEGCFIVRKADGFIMGESIDLGSADSIENYEDKPYTQEEYDDFCKKYDIKKEGEINHEHYFKRQQ